MNHLIATAVSVGLASGLAIGPARTARSAVDPSPASRASDQGNNGNGNHNRNAIGINSPTSNQGYQHTNNGNSGGLNPTLNALCRKAIKCIMRQNLIIIKVVNGKQSTPARIPPAVPSQIVAPPHLFMHMGTDGITMMEW